MNEKKNNSEFNGINTQILNAAFDPLQNPERNVLVDGKDHDK